MDDIIPSILLQLSIVAAGGVASYFSGWVFSCAIDDVEKLIRVIRNFLKSDIE